MMSPGSDICERCSPYPMSNTSVGVSDQIRPSAVLISLHIGVFRISGTWASDIAWISLSVSANLWPQEAANSTRAL